MRGLLWSTALALLFSGPIPFPTPDIFVYKSAQAQVPPGGYNPHTLPDWVAASCCGPKDAHKLKVEQVHDAGDTYVIDGYPNPIEKVVTLWGSPQMQPNPVIKPSGDGNYWLFYSDNTQNGGSVSSPYCFFIPLSG